jgi:hypothetical protein
VDLLKGDTDAIASVIDLLAGVCRGFDPDVSRAFQATRRLLNLLDLGTTKKLSAPIELLPSNHGARGCLGARDTQSGLA